MCFLSIDDRGRLHASSSSLHSLKRLGDLRSRYGFACIKNVDSVLHLCILIVSLDYVPFFFLFKDQGEKEVSILLANALSSAVRRVSDVIIFLKV